MAKIKPITWAQGYFVSDDGIVYSERRGSMKKKIANGKNEYARVCIMVEGVPTSPRLVHRLVAEAFVHKPIGCDIVNHLDGNKRNNVATNLEWTTHMGNVNHARASGLCGKLTDKDVLSIRQMRKEGGLLTGIAKLFGIDQSHVSLIASGKRYGWLA